MNQIECRDLINCNKDEEYSKNNIECATIEPIRIVRQYINPAVYVESSIYDMAPFKRSPLLLNYYSDDDSTHRIVKIKRCVCFTTPDRCPCHPSTNGISPSGNDSKTSLTSKRYFISTSPSLSSLKSFDTTSTIKPQQDELKLSIPSLITSCTSTYLDHSQKEEAFRNWCIKKDKERKRLELERLKEEEAKLKEREKLLEVERNNFRRWLAKKKDEEEKRRKEKEQEQENERIKQLAKEQKKMENDLKYRLWLKQKEQISLGIFIFESHHSNKHIIISERKIKEHVDIMKAADEKQKRMEQCMKAYDEWFKNSKYKPKPVPSNQGLESNTSTTRSLLLLINISIPF